MIDLRELRWRQRYRLRRVRLAVRMLARRAAGALRGSRIPVYWWNRLINFGDLLTPDLVARSGKIPVWAPSDRATLVGAGSVLQWLPTSYSGVIFGAGFIAANEARHFPNARFIAIRGSLSAARTNAPGEVVLGDPGLLARKLCSAGVSAEWPLGVVAHYLDRTHPIVEALRRRLGREVRWIEVQRSSTEVAAEIGRCERILSSSLHGLVVADALGIPNAWVRFSDGLVGGSFKFHDYYSALGVERAPSGVSGSESLSDLAKLTVEPPAKVAEVTTNLESAWEAVMASQDTF